MNLWDISDRFWAKVEVKGFDECWIWKGARTSITWKNSSQYGLFKVNRKPMRAHRVAWALTHGELPKESVLHECDVGLCMNPTHLFLGTHDDNMRDRDRKGRTKGGRLLGEANGRSKLTAENVLEIRRKYKSGKASTHGLAREFGVTQRPIMKIIQGKAWKHVQLPGSDSGEKMSG